MPIIRKDCLISIIVPVYNVEEYLWQCLDSIIKQTYKNLEIIIVDDWSTDKSGEICDEYEKKDKRVKVVHQENSGLSSARNVWIKIATWKYLWYIDSDDYVELDMFERLYNLIVKTESDIAICNRYFQNEDGDRIKNNNFPTKDIVKPNEVFQYFYKSMYVWNKLYKREIVKNIEFVETRAQDVIYNFKIFKRVKKIACLNECKNYYRYNPNSRIHTKRFSEKRLIFLRDWLDEEIKYADENKLYSLKNNLIESKVSYVVYWLSLLALEDSPNEETVVYLQNLLRKDLIIYLKSKRNLIKKCFSALVCVNFKLASIIYKFIIHNRN